MDNINSLAISNLEIINNEMLTNVLHGISIKEVH